jgi:hypothetical protein
MGYNRYPAVDENNNFPTPVRKALAESEEVELAIQNGQRDSYTKTETDATFAKKTDIPAGGSGTGSSTPVDAYTKTESDNTFAKKTDIKTPVDAYTKTETDDKYATKTSVPNSYTKTESDDKYASKTAIPNSYTKTETDDTFAKKTDIKAPVDSYTKTEADTKFALAGSGTGTTGYTKTETDDKFATKTYVDRFSVTNYGIRGSNSLVSAASLTPDPSMYSEHIFTALASALSIMNTATFPTSTTITLSIKDDGTARALTWGSAYSGMAYTLPASTVPGKALVMLFRYAPSRARWELMLLSQEA